MRKVLILGALLTPTALATDLELGGGWNSERPHFRVQLSDLQLGEQTTLLLGGSEQSGWLGLSTRFDASIAGSATASLKARYGWQGQYRLEGEVGGVLGSKATLNLRAHYGTHSLSSFDRFQAFQENPEPEAAGWGVELEGRYRLDRQWTLAAELGAGVNTYAQIGAQYRQEDSEYRFGTLWHKTGGQDVFGLSAGVTFRDSISVLTLDGVVALNGTLPVWGGKATIGSYGIEELFGSDLKLFAAYEPYRDLGFPMRFGVETDTPLDNGQVQFSAYFSQGGYAVRGTYRLDLDPEPAEEEEPEEVEEAPEETEAPEAP